GGDARADALVEAYARHPHIRFQLVRTANRNLATSRNVGLPQCVGEVIALTDDDAQVFPDWIAQIGAALKRHPQAGAVGGPVLGSNTHTLVGRVSDAVTFPAWPTARPVRTLPGVNVAYRAAVVRAVGAFDERLFRGEDVDYNWRVAQLGHSLIFDPTIRVRHEHRATWRGLLRQHWMYGRAYRLVRRKWPAMYCVYPHGLLRARDGLKAGYFVAGALIEPLRSLRRLPPGRDRLLAYAPMVANQLVWRAGMLFQLLRGD
ncbi:MAG: glycosyltransferase, partial [Chloroflexales bacterium]|nr:glycosyltransferase [Chloroflexales bacterium]